MVRRVNAQHDFCITPRQHGGDPLSRIALPISFLGVFERGHLALKVTMKEFS
jgi:hypothetical protein